MPRSNHTGGQPASAQFDEPSLQARRFTPPVDHGAKMPGAYAQHRRICDILAILARSRRATTTFKFSAQNHVRMVPTNLLRSRNNNRKLARGCMMSLRRAPEETAIETGT